MIPEAVARPSPVPCSLFVVKKGSKILSSQTDYVFIGLFIQFRFAKSIRNPRPIKFMIEADEYRIIQIDEDRHIPTQVCIIFPINNCLEVNPFLIRIP